MSTLQNARIVGPVAYTTAHGQARKIPLGPCLIEQLDDQSIDIIWGARGQSSAALPAGAVAQACEHGHLVLLD